MQEAAEAFAFQKLCQHLQQRLDAQNIDMMILAGFCRNCLCKWYHVGAATFGLGLTYEQSCEKVYGMPYATWKKEHQGKATEDQLRRGEQVGHASTSRRPRSCSTSARCPPTTRRTSCRWRRAVRRRRAAARTSAARRRRARRAALAQNGGGPARCRRRRRHAFAAACGARRHLLGVLTISDRASAGAYDDLFGPEMWHA